MKISARNQFLGKVIDVNEGAVNASVKIQLEGDNVITSTISLEAVKELELVKDKAAVAVIKATSVLLANGKMKLSARNQFVGTVKNINKGAINSIVKVEIAGGNVVSSTISNEAVNELGLEVGNEATVIVKATDVLVMA